MNNRSTLKIRPSGDREIIISRLFDAPRIMIFEAYTKPALIKHWLLGPPGWRMVVCDVDLRVGGKYRYVWRHTEQGEMGLSGSFREIKRPEGLACTEIFDQPWYPGQALVTLQLSEKAGKTELHCPVLYQSREARDQVLASSMEQGLAASYNRLAELLAS